MLKSALFNYVKVINKYNFTLGHLLKMLQPINKPSLTLL